MSQQLLKKLLEFAKMALGMLLALALSAGMVRFLFIEYSPEVRTNIPQYIALVTADTIDLVRDRLGLSPVDRKKPTLIDMATRAEQIAPGIRGSTKENIVYTEIHFENIELKTVSVTLDNGAVVKRQIPAHINYLPPIQGLSGQIPEEDTSE